MGASTVGSARRYYLAKRRIAIEDGDTAMTGVWRSKQEAEPGTPLSATFPYKSKLSTLGYTMVEDLEGAGDTELIDAGLSPREAAAVIAAME